MKSSERARLNSFTISSASVKMISKPRATPNKPTAQKPSRYIGPVNKPSTRPHLFENTAFIFFWKMICEDTKARRGPAWLPTDTPTPRDATVLLSAVCLFVCLSVWEGPSGAIERAFSLITPPPIADRGHVGLTSLFDKGCGISTFLAFCAGSTSLVLFG